MLPLNGATQQLIKAKQICYTCLDLNGTKTFPTLPSFRREDGSLSGVNIAARSGQLRR